MSLFVEGLRRFHFFGSFPYVFSGFPMHTATPTEGTPPNLVKVENQVRVHLAGRNHLFVIVPVEFHVWMVKWK